MSSPKLIRQAIKAQLEADATIVPALVPSVQTGRVRSLKGTSRPYLTLHVPSERVESLLADSPRVELRVLELQLTLHAEAKTGELLEDALDDAIATIFAAVLLDECFGGEARETFYQGFEKELTADGSSPSGSVTLRFEVYYEFETFSFVPPDDLDRITAGVDIDDDGLSEADVNLDYGGP